MVQAQADSQEPGRSDSVERWLPLLKPSQSLQSPGLYSGEARQQKAPRHQSFLICYERSAVMGEGYLCDQEQSVPGQSALAAPKNQGAAGADRDSRRE